MDERVAQIDELPQPLARLIGRDALAAETLDALHDPTIRFVALVGPGGVGKTRLAVHVATSARAEFNDGVVLVQLEGVAGPDALLSMIASTLGLPEPGDEQPLHQLARELRDKSRLIVLDTIEHLVNETADLVALLAACPRLVLLVTSRVRLRHRGVREIDVAPLPVPGTEQLLENPAVQLFLERADEAQPDRTVSKADLEDVAEMCRRLDCLPLAIELAAARLSVITLTQMRAGLFNDLDWLSGGPRDLPERQRTLRNTIAWSVRLLPEPVARLFATLSVFADGFDLSMAAQITDEPELRGSDSAVQPQQLVDAISTLVDASLLIRRGETAAGVRFGMLETVRSFGLELLTSAGVLERSTALLLEVMTTICRTAGREMTTGRPDPAIDRVDQEEGNIRAALESAFLPGRAGYGLALGTSLAIPRFLRGRLLEGFDLLARLLKAAGPDVTAVPRAEALAAAGALAEARGDYESARALLDEAIRLGREHDLASPLATGLVFRALVSFDEDRMDEAELLLLEAESMPEGIQYEWRRSVRELVLGMIALRRDDYAAAEARLSRSLQRFTALDLTWGIALAQGNLGFTRLEQNDFRNGQARLVEALALFHTIGDRWGIAMFLDGMARYSLAQRKTERAATLFGAHAALLAQIGTTVKPVYRAGYEFNVRRAREALSDGLFDEAWREGEAMTLEEVIAYVSERSRGTVEGSGLYGDLSVREVEVLRLMTRGLSDRRIGETLFISTRTVTTHATKIFTKLGVTGRTGASIEALSRGLV